MSLALYRRYRPVTFDEVIGQAHVTVPLMNALTNGRVHHAFLFSGPRGCGKTSSARILARSLNCEQGPTPTPCGVCRSCRDLSADGGGSLDVIEIDAASHGGVDDARELLETTAFSPASSRFKIYIIDEAHMVSPQGFNALLKVVEEPPDHVKFVFATTEPDKVLGTIRSRTHHYPFHLVPPSTLEAHLARVCEAEGVTIEKGVLPLVVRGGAGSVRDALSLLDQLIAGSKDSTVGYALTANLLGFTDATLLDDAIEALAASDGAEAFQVVDRIVEGGLDPRRFAADLLERLRDLIILDAVPDAGANILRSCPDDALDRMRGQATRFGGSSLARAADVVNAGLIEMRGATSPRLQLELIIARALLPAVDADARGLYSRLERLERRIGMADLGQPGQASVAAERAQAEPTMDRRGSRRPAPAGDSASGGISPTMGDERPAPAPAPAAPRPPAPPSPREDQPRAEQPPAEQPAVEQPAVAASAAASSIKRPPAMSPGEQPPVAASAEKATPPEPEAQAPAGLDLVGVRRLWPEVLDALKGMKRSTWALVGQQAHVLAVEPGRLVLAVATAGLRDALSASGHDEIVRQALIDVLGVDWQVVAVVDPGAAGGERPTTPSGPLAETTWTRAEPVGRHSEPDEPSPASSSGHRRPQPGESAREVSDSRPGPAEGSTPERPTQPPDHAGGTGGSASSEPLRPQPAVPASGAGQPEHPTRGRPRPASSARPGSPGTSSRSESTHRPQVAPEDDIPDADDLAAPAQDDALTGRALLERELGATVIEEYENP